MSHKFKLLLEIRRVLQRREKIQRSQFKKKKNQLKSRSMWRRWRKQ